MTTWCEQDWLRTYAARRYRGRGAIVDIGCFVGGTTIALAEGLRLNAKHGAKQIHAYDRFRWNKDFELWAKGTDLEGRFAQHDTFLPEFLRRTEAWRENIVVHEGDLINTQWQNGPIEFLLIDAMKNPATAGAIARGFFPYLLPRISYVAHQDFSHAYTPWIHLLMFRLRDYFAFTADVASSGMTVFRCRKQIPASKLNMNLSLTAASEDEIEAAFDYSLGFVSRRKKLNILAAKAMAYHERGNIDRARKVLQATRPNEPSLAGELDQIKRLVGVG